MSKSRRFIPLVTFLFVSGGQAQQDTAAVQTYASINRRAIDYTGPGREASRDLAGPEIRIGLIAPLQGARKAEGNALVAAAQMAVEDESATPFAGGQRLELVTRDETGLWGRASGEIVKLVVDDRAVALITSSDGRAAHLSEQVGNRLGVPVVTLATDATTTQINIPWLFRIVPNDAAQARAFAERIYRQHAFRKVLLIAESDHDGRVGAEEFEKAARALQAPVPERVEITLPLVDRESLSKTIEVLETQAIVVWASAAAAAQLLEGISITHAGIYLCRKAIEEPLVNAVRGKENTWIAASRAVNSGSESASFAERYRSRTGAGPGPAATAAYDAVRLIAAGLRESGPNRARLRDALATRSEYRGVSGAIALDGAGNNQTEVALVPLR